MQASKLLVILFLLLIAPACSWVDLKSEAESVRIASIDDVVNCKKVAASTVTVKADVATFARDKETMRRELETLARNNAIPLGGNVVVPVSTEEKGTQSFNIYHCP